MSASIFDREINTDVRCPKCKMVFPDELALEAHKQDVRLIDAYRGCRASARERQAALSIKQLGKIEELLNNTYLLCFNRTNVLYSKK